MGNECCTVCNEELKFMNTTGLGAGKLKDGKRVCRFCFKKITDIDIGFGINSRTKYDTGKVLELLGVSTTEAPLGTLKINKPDRLDSFEKYAEYTRTQNWKAICELNNVNLDSFGTKKELQQLPNYLEKDEFVFALTSGVINQTVTSNSFDFGLNTWLVVLTNERFLFLDCAMLTRSVDIQSIRHDHVQAVSSSQGLILGKIMVDLGSRMVTVDNCQKAAVSVFTDLGNKLIKKFREKSSISPNARIIEQSPVDKLEKLAALYSTGALTEEEFNVAKKKILLTI